MDVQSTEGDSEFVKAARAVPIELLISVLDEHMRDLRVLYPKTYAGILEKLR